MDCNETIITSSCDHSMDVGLICAADTSSKTNKLQNH